MATPAGMVIAVPSIPFLTDVMEQLTVVIGVMNSDALVSDYNLLTMYLLSMPHREYFSLIIIIM